MPTTPTPEQIETKRAEVAAYDAAQTEAQKEANRAKLQPLIDVGLGGSSPLTCSPTELAALLRTNAAALSDLDATLPNLAFSTAQVLETMNDRVRMLVAQNAVSPVEPFEGEA